MQIASCNPQLALLRSEHCWGEHRTVYSARRDADLVMASIRTWTRKSRYYVPGSIPVAETAPNIELVPSLRSLSGMITIASVFAIVGGFLDAYSYLARGGVFANAQTGNVVLFGVRAAAGNWTSACRTLPSILAYICGVAVARVLRVRPQKRIFRATLICQALELFVLVVLLFFGRFLSDLCAVALIAFSAALQNT